MKDIVTTTFHLNQELYWELKSIVAKDKKSMKETYIKMIRDMINDWKDSHSEEALSLLCNYESDNDDKHHRWCEFKRRIGLDGLQGNYSGGDCAKGCEEAQPSRKDRADPIRRSHGKQRPDGRNPS